MNTELMTVIASATTSAKNVYDLANQMVNKRKGNYLITRGELKMLEVAISRTIERERMSARHELGNTYITYMKESFENVKGIDVNSTLGLILLQEIRDEAQSYMEYLHDFNHLTNFRGI